MIRVRLFAFVIALVLAAGLLQPALGQQKPLVTISGQTRQLPAGTTLGVQPSTTGAASINIPAGVAPSAPNDGDCWMTSSGVFCRVNGATVGPYISAAGVPAANLAASGNGGVTGVLPLANGGTNAASAGNARTNLGATTVGGNLFTLTNPSAITFPRFNADNTVSALDAATFRTAIGAGTGGGSVTSVAGSGGTTGLTLSGGPITGSGTLTLGGTLALANGGTGGTTASTARTNLGLGDIATQSAGSVSITGGSIAGITDLAVADGGTGASTASAARTNLGATTVGGNLFTLTNPSAITFPRFNADNTVSALDAATFRTAIGAGTGGGSVTSVAGSGGTTGLTLSGGPITGSGTLTLGGTLAVANGGTGGTTASSARTNLGATTVGGNLFTLTNPSAITFPRFNADNTVSALDAASTRTALGLGTTATQNTGTSGASVPLLNGANTWSADQTLTSASASAAFLIDVGAGNSGSLAYRTGGANRWVAGKSSTAESGSNAGSNYIINRYDDAGASLGTVLTLNRATGNASFSGALSGASLSLTTPLPVSSGGTGAATAAANRVLASPNGSTGAPSFRALVNADLPATISPTADIRMTATTAPYVDLTASNTDTAGGTFIANENAFSYYPIVGWQTGDHQRAQVLTRFKSQYDTIRSETGIAIDSYINTGFSETYATSTAYTAGEYVVVPSVNYIYQVAGNCTSGGSPPVWPSSGSVVNGTCTFNWAAYGQQNAKMPLFVQTVADAGAGNTWSGVFNTIYKSGYAAQFGASVEIDVTNNSGADLPTHSGIYLASGGGSNEIGAGLVVAGHAGSNFTDAIAIGAEAASQADIHSYGAAAYGYLDNGTHDYGLYFNGTYANQTAFIGGTTSNTDGTGTDQGQVMISPTDGANRLQMGYVYQAGVKEYGRIQASNSVGPTALYLNAAGGAVLIGGGGAQLIASTVATLPTCNSGASGLVSYVTDANAPSWNATLSGGGSTRVLALCNGTNWTAH